jgi:hypothetical protein
MNLEIKSLDGESAREFFNEIAQIRIDLFREFPYLYDGSIEYEREYLETYFKSKNSKIILGLDKGKIVAFSSSISLNEEIEEIKAPFLNRNLDISQYHYIGEVMIKNEYRNLSLPLEFERIHKEFATQKGHSKLVFMTVRRELNDISRPYKYKDPEKLWRYIGYKILDNMNIEMSWKRIDTGKDENNVLDIWQKNLN